jgi:hypothetical protein
VCSTEVAVDGGDRVERVLDQLDRWVAPRGGRVVLAVERVAAVGYPNPSRMSVLPTPGITEDQMSSRVQGRVSEAPCSRILIDAVAGHTAPWGGASTHQMNSP